ncbi:MAG: squalene--hopene cyclase [Puniceicoccales bacterium]|nr:squalene--hopene cyclase [Puniceicoccales bacterium]
MTDHAAQFNPASCDSAIARALEWLARNQQTDGSWNGMLESNCCMEAQWVLAMHILGRTDDKNYQGILRAILQKQRPDGSWEVYHEAPEGDINTTVECYAALRSAGHASDSPPLQRARQWILTHGGLAKIRLFTRFWLALVGQWPWDTLPIIPPEIYLVPKFLPFNIYKFASWARATFMSMSVVSARQPVFHLPRDRSIDELFPEGRERFDFTFPLKPLTGFWPAFFNIGEKFLALWQRLPWKPLRETSIRLVLEWIIKHQDADGAWGGIQPPWIYALIALHTEGYHRDHPTLLAGVNAWHAHWTYERNGATHIQASESPVWDTMLATQAALDAGATYENFPPLRRALDYILDKQILGKGDWAQLVPNVECGGWAFERANTWYPDLDDTAVALTVLAQLRPLAPAQYHDRITQAFTRAEIWLRAMQSRNGGWGAFDKDNDTAALTQIPFCDFGEVLDPPSADLTGHKLEALGHLGHTLASGDPTVHRAVSYLIEQQEPDGPWFGRWGVNYIYGTALVLPGLRAVGYDMASPHIQKAGAWLLAHQNPDGGWGESCGSYMDDKLRGTGPSTPSQTAWAMLALLALDTHAHDEALLRGAAWLLSRQTPDGTWEQSEYTGTGFPGYGVGERIRLNRDTSSLAQGRELARGFMINYNMYRHYFPLQALGRLRKHLAENAN